MQTETVVPLVWINVLALAIERPGVPVRQRPQGSGTLCVGYESKVSIPCVTDVINSETKEKDWVNMGKK